MPNERIDITSMEALNREVLRSALPLEGIPLSSVLSGDKLAGQAGAGFDIYGVGDWQPGDKRIHIPSTVSSGKLQSLKWEDEKSVPCMVVSDMPRDFYGNTLGDTYSVRALGLLAANAFMHMAIRDGDPVSAIWTNGLETVLSKNLKNPISKTGISIVLNQAVQLAQNASEQTQNSKGKAKPGLFKRTKQMPVEMQKETDSITTALKKAVAAAKKILPSRIVVISDFRASGVASSGRTWSEILQTLGKTNQIITVEVKNPLLKALPDDIQGYRTGTNSYVLAESQKQAYQTALAERNREITTQLKNNSNLHVVLDTSEADWMSDLTQQLRAKH